MFTSGIMALGESHTVKGNKKSLKVVGANGGIILITKYYCCDLRTLPVSSVLQQYGNNLLILDNFSRSCCG